jgi:hypothetical protein
MDISAPGHVTPNIMYLELINFADPPVNFCVAKTTTRRELVAQSVSENGPFRELKFAAIFASEIKSAGNFTLDYFMTENGG